MSSPDEEAGKFAQNLMSILNHGSLSVLLNIAHRTTLFDKMAELSQRGKFFKSTELAEKSKLNERYVRELLAGLAAGKIIQINDSDEFFLPASHSKIFSKSEF